VLPLTYPLHTSLGHAVHFLAIDLSQIQITMKSSYHFFFSHLGMPTLQNWTQFSNANFQSQSHIVTDRQSVSKSWCRAPSEAHDQIFLTVSQLRSCLCGAPSWMRGLICLLYMLLSLASAISRIQVPWDLRPYFTVSDLKIPFSLPFTTRRFTVEVFDPVALTT
jgi:hypothetical protein